MKKLIFTSLAVFLCAFAINANTSMYHLDQNAVDQMFAQAEQVDIFSMHSNTLMTSTTTTMLSAHDKDPTVAFILAWVLGPLGIHRAYLGTSTGTIIGYILTAGGCGIISTIDWVLLLIGLINNDIDNYVDNPSFFMW